MPSHPPVDATSEEFTIWRRRYLKRLILGVLAVSGLSVCAPIINANSNSGTVIYWAGAFLIPTLGLVRGARALLFPEETSKVLAPLLYGSLSAIVFLAFSPWAIQIALRNFALRPSLILFCSFGVGAILTLLIAIGRRAIRGPFVT
jgi:hypothetical protein